MIERSREIMANRDKLLGSFSSKYRTKPRKGRDGSHSDEGRKREESRKKGRSRKEREHYVEE